MSSQEKKEKQRQKAHIDALILMLQETSYRLGKELETVSTDSTLSQKDQSDLINSRRKHAFNAY